jgi:hypothetical protein
MHNFQPVTKNASDNLRRKLRSLGVSEVAPLLGCEARKLKFNEDTVEDTGMSERKKPSVMMALGYAAFAFCNSIDFCMVVLFYLLLMFKN